MYTLTAAFVNQFLADRTI